MKVSFNKADYIKGFIVACVNQIFEAHYTKHGINIVDCIFTIYFLDENKGMIDIYQLQFKKGMNQATRVLKQIINDMRKIDYHTCNIEIHSAYEPK